MNDLFRESETSKSPEASVVLSVSALSKRINDVLDGRIGSVDVVGQINSPRLGQHWYFTLADGDAKIDCAMWSSRVKSNDSLVKGWKPKQGDQVIVTGTVGHYAKFGKTQIYVQRIKPVGEEKGKLQQQFDALVNELREKGWFDASRKKALPKYPRRIAVITSASSAAVRDVMETARRRWTGVSLLVINVPVQGDAAAPAIIEALHRVDRAATNLHVDAIIVTRGGGSLEELWSFNDRDVVVAAYECNTPIVAAIGHESDTTIIELVADHRASTPTQAAMVLVPDAQELMQMVQHYEVRIGSEVKRSIERSTVRIRHTLNSLATTAASGLHAKGLRIAALGEALATRRPHALMQARQKRVLTCRSNLRNSMQRDMTKRTHRIESLASRLEAIGPSQVLRRGFTLTQDASGKIVRSTTDVQEGQQITTVLADGTIKSKVECAQ